MTALMESFDKKEYSPSDLNTNIKRDTVSSSVDNVSGLLSSIYRGLVDESVIFPIT